MVATPASGAFNPPVQEQADPRYYLHLFQPINVPEPKNALATGLKDTGTMLEGAAKAAETYSQKSAANEYQEGADKIQDDQISYLQRVQNLVSGKPQVGQPQNPFGPPDPNQSLVVSSAQAPLPKDVQQLPDQLNVLDSANGAGKFSDTYYRGKMAMLAKDVRSRYNAAGRQAVDSAFEKSLGHTPANVQIEGLLKDINSYMGGKNKEMDDFNRHLDSFPDEGFVDVKRKVNSGEWTLDQGWQWLGPRMTAKYKDESEKRSLELKEQQDKVGKADYTRALNSTADETHNFIRGQLIAGTNWTTQDVEDQIHAAAVSGQPLPAGVPENLAQLMRGQAQAAEDHFRKGLPKNVVDNLGMQAVNENAAAVRKPYETIAEMLQNKDYGMAGYYERVLKSMHSQSGFNMWNDQKMKPYNNVITGARMNFGDQAASNLVIGNELPGFKSAAQGFKDRTVYDIFDKFSPAKTDPSAFTDLVRGSVGRVADAHIDTNQPSEELSEQLKTIKNLMTSRQGGILDPQMKREQADNIIAQAYNIGNYGMLAPIMHDTHKPDGTLVPGKESWLKDWTQPKVLERVKQAGQLDNAEAWVKHIFETDIAPDTISKFAAMPLESPTYKVNYVKGEGESAPHLELEVGGRPYKQGETRAPAGLKDPTSGRPLQPGQTMNIERNYQFIDQQLQVLNKGMEALYNVSKARGDGDIDAHVVQSFFNALREQSPQENYEHLSKIGHLPTMIVKAIAATRGAGPEEPGSKDQARVPGGE